MDDNLHYTWFTPGASGLPTTLPVGSVVIGVTGANVATPPASVAAAATNLFLGVTVRHNEPTGSTFPLAVAGDTYAQVMGPVTANTPIGLSAAGGGDFATNGAYLAANGTPSVGVALGAISGATVALVKVRLGGGAGSSGGGMTFRGLWVVTTTYNLNDVVVIQTGISAGPYISLLASNTYNPAAGTGWMQLAPGNLVGAWT